MCAIFFGASRNYVLKTIAHTLSMSTKQKALSGRPVKAYSITDTVKMVSCIEIQGVKVDMVEGVLSLICFKFSLISYFFLSTQILYC